MPRLARTLAAALLAAAALPGGSARAADPAARPPAAGADQGLVVFHSRCSRCHGADGRGKAIFTTPSMVTSTLDQAAMERVIAAGRGRMPSFRGDLSSEEIRAVAAFIKRDLAR